MAGKTSLLLLSLWISCYGVGAEETRYYQINFKGRTIGYIQQNAPILVNHNRNIARIRKTYTAIKSLDRPEEEQQIFEETLYQKPYQIFLYSLEYIQGGVWERYSYCFEEGKVTITLDRDGTRVVKREMPIRSGVHVISDYFSLLPHLEETKSYRVLYVLDPKQIVMTHSTVQPQKLAISPEGEKLVTVCWQQQLAHVYLIQWGDKSLRYYISGEGDLLKLEDTSAEVTISFTTKESLDHFNASPQKPGAIENLPFALGQNYRYVFYYVGKEIGSMIFQIQETEAGQYKILAQGNFPSLKKPYDFESQTIYDREWRPVFYHIQEGAHTEVECDFVLQGVKEKYRESAITPNQEYVLERFVHLPDKFVLLDNNAIHHFAVFVGRLPLQEQKNTALVIFHPRRLQCTEGSFSLTRCDDGNFEIRVETAFYSLQLQVTPQGKLIRYVQGGLDVRLE